jgi:alkanesulfonate monooxygenase SsuD/methylene tetrahydromethanopterin reductase-like flavin-dependent oxidoreductase (luciferase family)
MNQISFGIRLPVTGPFAQKKLIVETALVGEEFEYDSVWTQGHLLWTRAQHIGQLSVGSFEAISPDQDPNKFDSITVLSYLAGITERIRLGFSVFVIPMTHPVVTAKIIADLDVLSDGRVIFCTSPGGPLIKPDFELLGINHENRAKIAEEYIPAVRDLWTNDNCSFDGTYVKYNNVSLYPKPVQKPHPPIWIAGGNPKSVSRAARYGSGWMLSTIDPRGLLPEICDYSDSINRCRKRAVEFGRNPEEINEYALEIFGCIARTDQEAFTIASKTIDARRSLHAKHFANLPSVEQVLRINLVGSPRTISKKIEEFRDAGATTLEIRFIARSFEEMKEMIKVFSTEVMRSF